MKPKNKAAVRLGKMAKGVPKRFSPEEISKRTERLRLARESKAAKKAAETTTPPTP